MANRRFEMYQYRQVLTRMRLGESDRAIARSGLMGRQKASALREVAGREGWLAASIVLPDDATLAQVLEVASSRPQSASSVLPYQDTVTAWWRQGIRGTVIHQALVDTYGYAGSYSVHPAFSPAAQRRSSRRHHRVELRSGRRGAGGLWTGSDDQRTSSPNRPSRRGSS